MICALCSGAIKPGDAVNLHHPVYRSEGGTKTEPTHKACHVAHHSERNDFRRWGKLGGEMAALTRAWAFNLLNVKTDPLYDAARAYYTAFYAH